MLNEFKLYTDLDATVVFDHEGGDELVFDADGDTFLVLANMEASPTKKLQKKSNPGVADLIFEILDSNPGSGHENTSFKLATTSGGLDTATEGVSLNLGHTVDAGLPGKVVVHIRFADETGGGIPSTELSFRIADTTEVAI